jgi:uncharacterized spore protein YtfJ
MSMLETLLDRIGDLQQRAAVKTVFGEPYQVNGRTIIPVAKVCYGFGLGAGRAGGKAEDDDAPRPAPRRRPSANAGTSAASGPGGGGGGGVSVRPVAVLEIAGTETRVRPIVDVTRLAIAGMLLAAWNVFWISYTVRRTAARRSAENPRLS